MAITSTPIVIGIDTGNRCVKTTNHVFVAGLTEVPSNEGIYRDALTYNGRHYALTNHRNSYQNDKTRSDDYFIMSLFAIQKELSTRKTATGDAVPVALAVGLPMRDYIRLKADFRAYFSRGEVAFECREVPYHIIITDVKVYPQGFSAAYADYHVLKNIPKVCIIDIGGYTTDFVELHCGRLDLTMCSSINRGMIPLYNRVLQQIESKTGRRYDEDQIDYVLSTGREINGDGELPKMVKEEARLYFTEMINKLSELGIDLTTTRGVFVGGGAIRLREFIEKSGDIREPYFIPDINANARGYEAMNMKELSGGKEE